MHDLRDLYSGHAPSLPFHHWWSIAHHFFAGIRFLLIDAEIGVEKSHARMGAWLVMLAEAITLFVIVCGVGL